MIVIKDVLVSEDLLENQFVCDLDACKGACCWEGDYGAPIAIKEIEELNTNLPKILPYLTEAARQRIKNEGVAEYIDSNDGWATTLIENGPCAFLTYTDEGIGKCGIEKAWANGDSSLQKPISCHLYPLRVSKNEGLGFEAWNYEKWDICTAACSLGEKLKVPVYKFLKSAIIRAKGMDFYNELESAAEFNAQKAN